MRILITGSSGQIGSFLLPTLNGGDHEIAIFGRSDTYRTSLQNDYRHFKTNHYEMVDFLGAIENFQPDCIVNLASLSSVAACEKDIELSKRINLNFPLQILSALEKYRFLDCFFVQASSSEMFSGYSEKMISESTELFPNSTYGKHKSEVHRRIQTLQSSGEVRASSIVLFNNESSKRQEIFATKKIVRELLSIKLKRSTELRIGNDYVSRDWNHPSDTCEAIRLIVEHGASTNYVVGSGELHTVREFVNTSALLMGLKEDSFRVINDPMFVRQNENHGLYANNAKIREELGWQPRIHFKEIVRELVEYELARTSELGS